MQEPWPDTEETLTFFLSEEIHLHGIDIKHTHRRRTNNRNNDTQRRIATKSRKELKVKITF